MSSAPLVAVILMLASGVRSESVVRYTIGEEEETFVQRIQTGEGRYREFSSFSRLFEFEKRPIATQLLGFSWSNCGDPKAELLVIQSVSISPDPITLPGTLAVNFMGVVNKTLDSPLQVALELEKKVLIWIKVPCIDNIGSCTYSDICSMMSQTTCPPVFKTQGIPCQCPYKKGPYKLTNATITIGAQIPSGDYRITARFSMNGEDVGCYKMSITFA